MSKTNIVNKIWSFIKTESEPASCILLTVVGIPAVYVFYFSLKEEFAESGLEGLVGLMGTGIMCLITAIISKNWKLANLENTILKLIDAYNSKRPLEIRNSPFLSEKWLPKKLTKDLNRVEWDALESALIQAKKRKIKEENLIKEKVAEAQKKS